MVGGQSRLPDYVQARAYALDRLERELPDTLFYHSIWHTRDEVATRTVWLAHQEGISEEGEVLALTAAYFHDIGFTMQRHDHETASARIAADMLSQFNYTPDQIKTVAGIILATRLPQSPHNHLEEIVADADLDVLGRDDFLARNQALRIELAADGKRMTNAAWYTQQAEFLRQHHYFTASARRDRRRMKQENLLELRQILTENRTMRRDAYLPPTPSFAIT